MKPLAFFETTLVPGLRHMTAVLGPHAGVNWEDQERARVLEAAFAGQESNWQNVQQGGDGPGRGFFQFEPPTCGLVLRNPVSRVLAAKLCLAVGIPATQAGVYGALLTRPIEIAVPFARLDTLCDPRPLPPLNDPAAAWAIYLEEWRPGKPHPANWARVYQGALDANQQWSNP